MKRDYERDRAEIVSVASKYQNMRAIDCIEDYAKKRKVVTHRIGKAFWSAVDNGEIGIYYADGAAYIK